MAIEGYLLPWQQIALAGLLFMNERDKEFEFLDKPPFALRHMNTEDYRIDKLYDHQRWMCPNCGLVFDYKFDHELPGWPALDYDHLIEVDDYGDQYMTEGAPLESCPRCGFDFSERSLLPVKVSQYVLGVFTKLTFVVEDNTQKKVIETLGQQLKKDVDAKVVNGSANVENFFNIAKDQGTLTNGYFLIDGDNRRNPYPNEPNFIHLEKYCIENYLLDFEICGEISIKEAQQIRAIILEIVKQYAKGKDSLLNLLFNRLSESDITDESLKYVDGSLILKSLLQKLGIKESDFIDKYIAKCQEKSKLAMILPSRIVEIIQNA